MFVNHNVFVTFGPGVSVYCRLFSPTFGPRDTLLCKHLTMLVACLFCAFSVFFFCLVCCYCRPKLSSRQIFRIGTVRYNWPMSAHASQAFSTAHCTDSEDFPRILPTGARSVLSINASVTLRS